MLCLKWKALRSTTNGWKGFFERQKLQVPRKKRVRIPASEQKSVVEQALYPHHIWCIDFQEDALLDGAKVKILNVLDEFTREWLFGRASLIKSAHWVKQTLRVLFEQGNTPASVRSDNGGEFIALTVKAFLLESGSESAFIEKGCPWENGIIESFHGKLRDEFLNRECFTTLAEFNIRLETHRLWYNIPLAKVMLALLPFPLLAKDAEHILAKDAEHILAKDAEHILAKDAEHILAKDAEHILAKDAGHTRSCE